MGIGFDLSGAHPAFRRIVPSILLPLHERYPGAKLRRVSVYDPEDGDTSMGLTLDDGSIKLNKFWFGRAPAALSAAAKHHAIIDVGDAPMGWHGPMQEPEQVLVHEFFHAFRNGFPEVMRWADPLWAKATRDPKLAPTGYALANSDEFWAEAMAMRELGYEFEILNSLEEFLRSLR